MQQQQQCEVQQISFEQLLPISDLSNSGNLIQTYIKGHNWTQSFQCITELRKINKYHPQYIPDIIDRFSSTILDLLSTGKTLLVKNILKFIKQLFDSGKNINVQKAVYAFLPVLIKKASTEIGYIKNVAQQVLTSFASNCGYQISFIITSQFCCDKNSSISQLSIKLLAVLIQNIGNGIMQLNQNVLLSLMKCLSLLIQGKRQNMKNSALDICIFLFNSMGNQNYLKLMQFCLKPEQVNSMGNAMQVHRVNKQKPLGLKQAIQNRKTENFNVQFFNDNNKFNNFIPLGQKNMNYQDNNQYNQSYNQYNNNNMNNMNENNYY